MRQPNWRHIREQLWERCGGVCEVSGLALDFHTFDAHHRRNKGMGGTTREDRDWLTNLLALDPVIHNGGPQSVHGRRVWSQERGFLVPKDVTWAGLWPVKIQDRRWVMLGQGARYFDLLDR